MAEEVDLASHGKHFHECHRSRGLPAPTYIQWGTSCRLVGNGDNVVVAITYIQWGHRLFDHHSYNDIEDNMMLATTIIQWTTMNIANTMATMWQ